MAKVEIVQDKCKVVKKIKGLEHLIKNDINEKDKKKSLIKRLTLEQIGLGARTPITFNYITGGSYGKD